MHKVQDLVRLNIVDNIDHKDTKKGCGCDTKQKLRNSRSLVTTLEDRIVAMEIEHEAVLLFMRDVGLDILPDWENSRSMYIEHVKGEEG